MIRIAGPRIARLACFVAFVVSVAACADTGGDNSDTVLNGGDASTDTRQGKADGPDVSTGVDGVLDASDASVADGDAGMDTGVQDASDVGLDTAADADVSSPDVPDAPDAMDAEIFDAPDVMVWDTCQVMGEPGVCIDVAFCDGGRVTTSGLCPGPSEIRCCHEPAGNPMTCDETVRVVPASNEMMTESVLDPACPAGMVQADGFCVDRWEAALVEVLGDGTEVPHSPYFNPGNRTVRAVSVAGAVPQGYISGTQAAAACAEAGKRLCTDTEWIRACSGSAGSTYPYGNTRQDGVCNDGRSSHPVVDYFGTNAGWIWSELGNPCIGQQADTVDLTGTNTGCESADGAFDMMGNLHEWTADPSGTFRGGFYVDTSINGEGCQYATTAHSSGHWDYSTGFRCCADLL